MSFNPRAVFDASDAGLTKAFYAELQRSPLGELAVNLFRAQKTSSRAKVYRGRQYKSSAYESKGWALSNLCSLLPTFFPAIRWGWKQDPSVLFDGEASWVLYVDIQPGQVSFHSPSRGTGPDYPDEFDGVHASEERIIQFCEMVLRGETTCAPILPDPPPKLIFGQKPARSRR